MKLNLRQLIEAKRQWHYQVAPEDASKGFHGWHSRGYLPHFDAPGTQQFITWRLADSLPAARRGEWEHLLRLADEREKQIQLEGYLDKGHGACVLRRRDVAEMVERTFLFDDGRRCRLLAWVIMPNHVHLLVEIWQTPLSKLLQSWKTLTSKRANALLGRSGTLWQEDYRDRYIRDEIHFRKSVRYIENNPVKAGLVKCPEEWRCSSAWWRANAERASEEHRSADAHVRANPPTHEELADVGVRAPATECTTEEIVSEEHGSANAHVRANPPTHEELADVGVRAPMPR